jgi:arylsulfatase A-like enzyme
MSHYAVHAPFQSDPRFADHYKESGKSEKAQAYATLIEGIDKSLGDIIAHVKSLGLGENTLILFLGDNGSDAPLEIIDDYSSSVPLKGKKGNNWEGGMRVPFIASWITPNEQSSWQKTLPIPQGAIQVQMGSVLDLFPTIVNLVNVSDPRGHILDGFDLKKQLEGKRNKKRQNSFLNHFPHEHRSSYFTSLVKGDWKAIYHYQIKGKPSYELFNLKEDPFESANLAGTKPKELKKMITNLANELKSQGALYPEKDGIPLKVIIP